MEKYTVKELTRIEGNHDPLNCEVPGCEVCKAFYAYSMKLRTQSEIMEQVDAGATVATIADNLCLAENYIQQTVLACTGGTIAAYRLKGYQGTLSLLVTQGMSIPAIAKRLNRSVTSVRQYFNDRALQKPDSQKMPIEVIKVYTGKKRYFDSDGVEYRIEKINQQRGRRPAIDEEVEQ